MGDLDFELDITSDGGRDYRVAVLRSPAGEAHTTMRFPFDELALHDRLQAIEIALLRSGGSRRRLASPEENTVLEFGRDLFDALVSGEVRSRFDVSRSEALRQGKPLRVKLRFDTPALATLPWEFLYDARIGEYLVLSTNTPLVRYIELPDAIEPLSVTPPLRILGMVASPSDLPALDVARERLRIQDATKELQKRGLVQIQWLENATWRDLQQALRREKWHIFHFVGHGGFDPNTDQGLIALVNEEGGTFRLAATELARLLGDHQPLRLALLNACEGARGSDHDLFASTAGALVRRGTPAVVAMQYEITDRAAIEFSRSFYEAVADGLPVDIALAEARKSVSVAINNTLEWGTPVLFMRSDDGVLFKIRRPREASGPAITAAGAGELVVFPTELDFGTLLVGGESPNRIIEIRSGKPTRVVADRDDILLTVGEAQIVVRLDTSRAGALIGYITVADSTTVRSTRVVARIEQPPIATRVEALAVAAPSIPTRSIAAPVPIGDSVPETSRRPRRTRLWVAAGAVAVLAAAFFLVRGVGPPGPGTIEVPTVVGSSIADARSVLETACTPFPCFDVSVTQIASEPGGPAPGLVVDQTPQSGQVAKGSTIVLSVVEAPSAEMITVPSLVELVLTDARNLLDAACAEAPCFVVDEQPNFDPGWEPGVVVAQTPEAGSSVEKGSQITLFVSQSSTEPSGTVTTTDLPLPVLVVVGTEPFTDASNVSWTRYLLEVTNWEQYPPELFTPAPDLEPCGANTNAARTWVDIWDASDSTRIYGFCALGAPMELTKIWFAVTSGDAPPAGVYVTLTDRRTGSQVRSSTVGLP